MLPSTVIRTLRGNQQQTTFLFVSYFKKQTKQFSIFATVIDVATTTIDSIVCHERYHNT